MKENAPRLQKKRVFALFFQSMAGSRKPAIGFIFITLLIDVMGFGIIIPVLPDLIVQLKHITVAEASKYGGYLLTAYALTQFFFSPVVGNLSDRFGRRPVILCSLAGFTVDYLFQAIVNSYGLLFIGRVVAGLTGASFTTASAYIADVSTPETRAKNFGMIGAAFGLGFVIGPALGGLISGWGIRAPFYAAAVLCFLNLLYGFFVLPESLAPENRRPFHWKKANPFGTFQFLATKKGIASMALCFFLIYLAAQAVQSNWSFFTEHVFSWTKKQIGFSLAIVGLLVGGVQAGLTPVIGPKLGNEKSIYLGLVLYSIGLLLFAFANQSWMMYAFLVPYCLGGIANPALQATISAHVSPKEQGQLQGVLTSLMSLTTVLGPLIITNLFSYFTSSKAPFYFPGIPFVAGAIFMIASLFVITRIFSRERKQKAATEL